MLRLPECVLDHRRSSFLNLERGTSCCLHLVNSDSLCNFNQRQSSLATNVKHGKFGDDTVDALSSRQGQRAILDNFVLSLCSVLHRNHDAGARANKINSATRALYKNRKEKEVKSFMLKSKQNSNTLIKNNKIS